MWQPMSPANIQTAIDRTHTLKARHGANPLLDSVIEQLSYLLSLADGTCSDASRLKDINIGLIAVREIEGADDVLAGMLHELAQEVRDRMPAQHPPTTAFHGCELTLTAEGGRTHRMSLPHPIIALTESLANGRLFVVTDPPAGATSTPNLFCVDRPSGAILWTKEADKSRSTHNVFTQTRFDPDTQRLIAWDWGGYRSVLNPEDGQVLETRFVK
jgi:hypothetical protein